MKNNIFKKALSLFLTVVMLMSCWVFVAPEKAEAIKESGGNYTLRFVMTHDNDADGGDIKIYYYPWKSDGSGFESSTVAYTGTQKDTLSSMFDKNDTKDITVSDIPGFPAKIVYKATNNYASKCEIDVVTYFMGTNVGSVTLKASANMFGTSSDEDELNYGGTGWTLPYEASISGLSDKTINLTADNATNTVTEEAVIKDQYGVTWNWSPKYTITNASGAAPTGVTLTENSNSDGTHGGVTVGANLTALCDANSYNSDTGEAKLTLKAAVNSGSASQSKTITLKSPQYTGTFLAADGKTTHDTKKCYYNGTFETPSNPAKDPDSGKHYIFTQWDNSLSGITQDTTFKPQYNGVAHSYAKENGVQVVGTGTHNFKCSGCETYGIGSIMNSYESCTWTAWTSTDGKNFTRKCTICNQTGDEKHDFSGQDRTVEGACIQEESCTQAGEYYYTCTVCSTPHTSSGYTNTTYTLDPVPHSYTEYGYPIAETCDDNGYDVYFCETCGEEYHEYFVREVGGSYTDPKTGIEYKEDENGRIFVYPATHIWAGNVSDNGSGKHGYKCVRDGGCTDSKTGWKELEDHEYNTLMNTITEPNCTNPGLGTYKCDSCDAQIEKEIGINPDIHNFNGAPVSQGENGHSYKCSYGCTAVGHILDGVQVEGAVVPHTPVYTDTGSDEVHKITCSENCGYETTEAHTWEETGRDGLTCETPGTAHFKCPVCQATKDEQLPAINHANKQKFDYNAPECEEEGNIEYYYCPDCQKYSTDGTFAEGTIITLEETVIPATGHDFSDTSKIHNLNNGYHNYECINGCGEYGIVDENGADVKNGKIACTYGEYTISATEHTHSCIDCRHTVSEEHKWSEWASTNPENEETEGQHAHYCTVCKYAPDAVDCTYEVTEDVASTCSFRGHTTYKCTECGHGYSVMKDLDSSNHEGDLDETKKTFVVDTASTCKEKGVGHWECVCGVQLGESEAIELDPTNHADYGTTTTGAVTPACTTEGFTGTVTCDGCGEILVENKSLGYDKNNHLHKTEYDQQDPTCTDIGYTAYFVCNDCGETVGKEEIPALGHDYAPIYDDEGNVINGYALEGDIHAYKCVRYEECGTHGVGKKTDAYEGCSGGEASCTKKAVCDVCGEEHGELELHSFTSGEYRTYTIDGVNYHNQKCLTCDAYGKGYIVDAMDKCSGGEATCDKAAECTVCGHEYGEALGHDFSMAKNRVNCLSDGTHNWKCQRCDAYGVVAEDADGNEIQVVNGTVVCEYTETVTPPTCTEAGSITKVCDYCGHTITAEGEPATGHIYTQKIIDEAHVKSVSTCTGATVYWYDCIGCDANAKDVPNAEDNPQLYYTNGDAAGHTWNGKTEDEKYLATPASCTKNATYYVHCTVCEEKVINYDMTWEKENSKLSHEWIENKTYLKSAADCDNAAVYYKECKNCHESSEYHDGATFTDGVALGHNFKAEITDVAHRKNKANCEAPATYYYACTRCYANAKLLADGTADNYTYSKGEKDPDNHTNLEVVPFQAATCEEPGHNAHKKCTGCNVELGKVVYAETGHDYSGEYVHIEGTDSHKQACVNGCGEYDAAEACEFGAWKQVEGTETHERVCVCGNKETGNCQGGTSSCTEKATCEICKGKYGTTQEHSYADSWTSNGDGTHSKACANCTAKLTENCSGGSATCETQATCDACKAKYGSTTDHNFINYVDSKPATCYTNKEQTGKCEYCSTPNTIVVPNSKLTHKMSAYVVTTEPTCKDEGVKTSTCEHGCGHTATLTIPADKNKHVAGEWVKNDGSANCTTGIEYNKFCTVCGEKLDTKTESGEHKWKMFEKVEPTCLTDGYENYVCELCGFTKTEWPEELKAKGEHTWGDMIVTKKATCSNTGRGYYECELCGTSSESQVIAKLAHGPENDVDLNGDGKLDNTRVIAPVAPTCDSKGHNGYWECLNCSYTSRESNEYVEYPALGHDDNDGDGKCDDCKFVIYDSDGDKDIDGSCGCICHNNSWFGQLIYKICRFFWKLFGMKPSCNCGFEHY